MAENDKEKKEITLPANNLKGTGYLKDLLCLVVHLDGDYTEVAIPSCYIAYIEAYPRYIREQGGVTGFHDLVHVHGIEEPYEVRNTKEYLGDKYIEFRDTLIKMQRVDGMPIYMREEDIKHISWGLPAKQRDIRYNSSQGLLKVYSDILRHVPLIVTGTPKAFAYKGEDSVPLNDSDYIDNKSGKYS